MGLSMQPSQCLIWVQMLCRVQNALEEQPLLIKLSLWNAEASCDELVEREEGGGEGGGGGG